MSNGYEVGVGEAVPQEIDSGKIRRHHAVDEDGKQLVVSTSDTTTALALAQMVTALQAILAKETNIDLSNTSLDLTNTQIESNTDDLETLTQGVIDAIEAQAGSDFSTLEGYVGDNADASRQIDNPAISPSATNRLENYTTLSFGGFGFGEFAEVKVGDNITLINDPDIPDGNYIITDEVNPTSGHFAINYNAPAEGGGTGGGTATLVTSQIILDPATPSANLNQLLRGLLTQMLAINTNTSSPVDVSTLEGINQLIQDYIGADVIAGGDPVAYEITEISHGSGDDDVVIKTDAVILPSVDDLVTLAGINAYLPEIPDDQAYLVSAVGVGEFTVFFNYSGSISTAHTGAVTDVAWSVQNAVLSTTTATNNGAGTGAIGLDFLAGFNAHAYAGRTVHIEGFAGIDDGDYQIASHSYDSITLTGLLPQVEWEGSSAFDSTITILGLDAPKIHVPVTDPLEDGNVNQLLRGTLQKLIEIEANTSLDLHQRIDNADDVSSAFTYTGEGNIATVVTSSASLGTSYTETFDYGASSNPEVLESITKS